MKLVKRIRRSALAALLFSGALGLFACGTGARADQIPDHLTLLDTLGSEAAGDILAGLCIPAGSTVHLVPETPNPANWLVARMLERALVARGYQVLSPAFGREGGLEGGAPAGGSPPAGGDENLPGHAPRTGEGQPGGGQGAQTGEEESSSGGQSQGTAGANDEELPETQTQTQGAPDSAVVRGEAEPVGTRPPGTPERTGGAATESGEVEAPFRLMLPASGDVLSFRVVECGITYPWVKRSLLVGPRRFGRIAAVRVWGSYLREPGHQVVGTVRGERMKFDTFPGWARPALEGQGYPFPLKVPEGSSLQMVVEPVVVAGVVAGLVYLFYQNQK
jgi:hypothetical protein